MGNKIKELTGKIKIKRTTILIMVFLLMSFILVRTLFNLQIIQGEDYIDSFASRTTKTRVIKSTRGNIYDRNGQLIAWNVLSHSVTLEDNGSYASTREKNLTLNGVAYQVIQILEKYGDSLSINFHIIVDETGNYAYDVGEGFTLNRFKADVFGYPLIDDMKDEEKNATAEEMMDHLLGSSGFSIVLEGSSAYTDEELTSHGLPTGFTKEELLKIATIRYQLNTNSFKKYMPVTIAENICDESVAALKENQTKLQGIEVVEDSMRQYVDDESMGPILGYIGSADAQELATLRESDPNYANDAVVGKAGIEQYMELTLHGTDGEETVTVDNMGKVLRIDESSKTEPIAGNDVYLTIDTGWQSAIYKILEQRVAGILLNKIVTGKEFDYDLVKDAAQIQIPIYQCYVALISNSIVDINKFDDADASQIERSIYEKFLTYQDKIFLSIRDELQGSAPTVLENASQEMQEYLTYIANDLLTDTLSIIKKDSLDKQDSTYHAWAEDQSISLKAYLSYAASQNWIDISVIDPEGDYLDSSEVYTALTEYLLDYLRTDNNFSKLLYKYMIMNDVVSGSEICQCLYMQDVIPMDENYESLCSGALSSYDFLIRKVASLEITPAMLAQMPCSASCVITDPNTGEVLACVSYPGYDNNRLSNNMDTSYYSKLALDQSTPFFNKATQQKTAPGSTMKLLSALVGFGENIIDDNVYFSCSGSFDLVSPPINCWNKYGHGSLEIVEAIEQSCNYFFNMIGFQAGKVDNNEFSEALSLQKLQMYAAQIGLDQKTGIEISEASPQVSDSLAVPSYIGQGTHLYTTSELARYVGTVANSGTVYKLSLLDKVLEPDGTVVEDYQPEVVNQMAVDDKVWDDIHQGMLRVLQTHKQFDTVALDVAGKTGTAEQDIYHPNHGLFVGYAPYDNPEVAMAIRIANGYTSGNACLVAADVIKYIFNLADESTIITGYASEDVSNSSND